MSFFGFGQSAEVEIVLEGQESRKTAEIKTEDGKKERYYLYFDGETVVGKVNVNLKKAGSKLEHQGIKIEFIGQIELYYDRGNHHEFTSLVKELARPGELTHHQSYAFEFQQVEKPYESYTGANVRLRYFLRVTLVKRISDVVKEQDIVVHTLSQYPDMNNSIKMEVGIEDCLHIEFEYNKSKYHLKDVIVGKIYFLLVRIKIRYMELAIVRRETTGAGTHPVVEWTGQGVGAVENILYHLKDVIVGKIYFLLVRIKIKHMELQIIKRETTGTGPNTFNENETIAKYEIMDGAPVRGESIPIRLFLSGYELTPSMRDINKKFSVRYYLNLVLVDEEERRYFKQQEIVIFRKADKQRKNYQQALQHHHPVNPPTGFSSQPSAKDGKDSPQHNSVEEEEEEGDN
ncbi:Vacuolar protein sorting-associated protein 26B [Nucella lapillus]